MLLKIIINKYKLYIYTDEIKKKNILNNLQLNSLKYLISLKLHQYYVYSKIIVKKKYDKIVTSYAIYLIKFFHKKKKQNTAM